MPLCKLYQVRKALFDIPWLSNRTSLLNNKDDYVFTSILLCILVSLAAEFYFTDDYLSLYILGAAMPMPPELMELYQLYQTELETNSKNEKETKFISDLNTMMRVMTLLL